MALERLSNRDDIRTCEHRPRLNLTPVTSPVEDTKPVCIPEYRFTVRKNEWYEKQDTIYQSLLVSRCHPPRGEGGHVFTTALVRGLSGCSSWRSATSNQVSPSKAYHREGPDFLESRPDQPQLTCGFVGINKIAQELARNPRVLLPEHSDPVYRE